jgi:hypothetical protein
MHETTWTERIQSGEYLVYYLRASQVLRRIVEEDLRLVWIAAGIWALPDIGDLLGEALDRSYLKQQQHGFVRLQEHFYGIVLARELMDWLILASSSEVFFYPGVLDGVNVNQDPFAKLSGTHATLMMPRPGSASFDNLSLRRKQVVYQRYLRAWSWFSLSEPCA